MNRQLLSKVQPAALAAAIRETPASEVLTRALAWLKARNAALCQTRRLKVNATVALPNKCCVSIIECDGREYLIGCGGTNLSLLSALPATVSDRLQAGCEEVAE
jgi:flagellar biogenesis protein FliO